MSSVLLPRYYPLIHVLFPQVQFFSAQILALAVMYFDEMWGVSAVLSQHFPEVIKVHLCAFFSQKLSATECYYHVVNQELLAVKLVLEEWRHWMEEA